MMIRSIMRDMVDQFSERPDRQTAWTQQLKVVEISMSEGIGNAQPNGMRKAPVAPSGRH
ncbi:MAG: hypothetical protein ACO26U_03355 [Burkholderiaceae bacterium]